MALVIPEVFADAVNTAMDVAIRVGRVATDYTDMVEDITTCGDKVHFPTIDRIADASVVTKGTPLVPSAVSMTDNDADIKQVGNSVRIFDKDAIQVKGALKDRMAEQLGQTMAKAVDKDLVEAIKEDAVYTDNVLDTAFDADAINTAFDVFGDEVDNEDFAGILINSKLRAKISAMDEFTSANKTYAANGNGIVRDGVIGVWNGSIPVILSNNGTSYKANVNNAEKDAVMLAIVKKNALGYVYQKSATVEEEREGKLLATDLIASELYATKLVNANGVSVLNVYKA